MNTRLLELKDYKETGVLSEADLRLIDEAAAVLREGGLCAFPTETVYGLGGNALNPEASAKIYAAKGRPSDNPLIAHISCLEEIGPLTSNFGSDARILAERFWPGPMTMVLPKTELVPKTTTGGLDTVAVRMPSHPVARELIRRAGVPVAAPSANLSGRPSPTTAAHCMEDLNGRVEMILDGGSCQIGVESTIVDVTCEPPMLLRPGAVTLEMLCEALGLEVEKDPVLEGEASPDLKPKAPGMKYRHYAPKAPMTVVCPKGPDSGEAVVRRVRMLLQEAARTVSEQSPSPAKDFRTAVICSEEHAECYRDLADVIRISGHAGDLGQAARSLFALLRDMDEEKVDYIAAEGFPNTELGYAIMNRMRKAAAGHIEWV